jgi:hypothetical protein
VSRFAALPLALALLAIAPPALAIRLVARPDPGLADEAHSLLHDVSTQADRIARTLGAGHVRPIEVRVHSRPNRIRASAPPGTFPPRGALGVAYPPLRRIDIALWGHEGALPMSAESLLLHEVAHVLVHDAASGRPVPRWLTEGIAVYFSGEYSFERFQALSGAVHAGRVWSIRGLSRGFSGKDHEVSAAYAESASLVAYLLEEDGPERLRDLLGRLGEGEGIESALAGAYGTPIDAIDRDFRERLARRYRLWPALTGTGVLWGIAAILLIAAYVRRRRERNRPWPEDEDQDGVPGSSAIFRTG